MGRYYQEYELVASGRKEMVCFSAYLDYRLDDGSKLHIQQDAAWCARCKRFALAESIPSESELLEEIAEIESRTSERMQWRLNCERRTAEQALADLRRRIVWRRSREGPPRCLECGSTGITFVPYETGLEFAHPKTGEPVRCSSLGFAVTYTWVAEFSPEGELIPGRYG